MGVDANFYTLKKISMEEMKEVIENEFGVPVEIEIYEKNHTRPWCGYNFTLKCGERRDLAFFPQSLDSQTWGTPDQVNKGVHACLHFGAWGKSTEILTRIGQHFGGYLDKDDCDNELDVYIEGKAEKRKKTIDKILK